MSRRAPAKKWQVYIVECANRTLYTGITNALAKRLLAHNNKRGARYTRAFGPVTLVWQEPHRNKSSALKREAAIKKFSRRQKLLLIQTKNYSPQ